MKVALISFDLIQEVKYCGKKIEVFGRDGFFISTVDGFLVQQGNEMTSRTRALALGYAMMAIKGSRELIGLKVDYGTEV